MERPERPIDRRAQQDRKRQRALELLARGYSQAIVAKSVGMSRTWVSQVALEERGASRAAVREEQQQIALALLAEGHTYDFVARKVGRSKNWVGTLARAHFGPRAQH